MKGFRLVFWAGIALVLSGLAVYGLLPESMRADTSVVRVGPMSVEVSAEGRTRVRERFVVSAPVDGWLARIGERAGDTVRRGEVVARIHPAPARLLDPRLLADAKAAVDAAEAALAAAGAVLQEAEASAAQAERDADAARILFSRGIVSRNRLDQLELAEKTTGARLRAANAALRRARIDRQAAESRLNPALETSPDGRVEELRSPVDGRILRVHVASEGMVAASAPLLELADVNDLEIVADFLSEDAASLEVGAPVRITQWGGPDLVGQVRRVEPSGFTKFSALGVEQQRVYVLIDFATPIGAGLGDGYRVRVNVTVWSQDEVVMVPVSALFRDGSAWRVFKIVEGRARAVNIVTGARNARDVQVLSGLEPGDLVVVYPPDGLKDGVSVRPREERRSEDVSGPARTERP